MSDLLIAACIEMAMALCAPSVQPQASQPPRQTETWQMQCRDGRCEMTPVYQAQPQQ